MKWFAISGSWRLINTRVEEDVILVVNNILSKGDGVITGGALGVDYVAAQTVIKRKAFNQIKIYLPIKLDAFIKHMFNRASEGVIALKQAELIKKQLNTIREANNNAIIDNTKFFKADEESYYARNSSIIELCNALYAFQVNKSKGTQDAITKARRLGKKVFLKEYEIAPAGI